MKRTWSIRLLVLLSLVSALLLSAAAPAQAAGTQVTPETSRLIINNRNSNNLYLVLEGPARYSFTVAGETMKSFTVMKGEYTYWVTACGAKVKVEDTLDLTINRTLVLSVCGGNAGPTGDKAHKVDLTRIVKIVNTTIKNEVGFPTTLYMTGTTNYVFKFKKDEERDLLLARGEYTLKYYGCGQFNTRDVEINKDKELTLTCPKP